LRARNTVRKKFEIKKKRKKTCVEGEGLGIRGQSKRTNFCGKIHYLLKLVPEKGEGASKKKGGGTGVTLLSLLKVWFLFERQKSGG